MNSTHRRWLRAATATVGAVALTFGGAVLPAAAADSPNENAAQQLSSNKYEAAAAVTGTKASTLKKLEGDGVIKVSKSGAAIAYVDEHAEHSLSQLNLPKAPEGAPIAGNPEEGSRPGAPVTVYLDFDGEVLQGTNWNLDTGIDKLDLKAPASMQSKQAQAWIWASVAEDYAPFNVNVRTTNPGAAKMYKTSASDNEYGSHVIITDTYDETVPDWTGFGGFAWIDAVGSDFLRGALVYTKGLGDDVKNVAEAASHEAGHNFGLKHDGFGGQEYYNPQGGLWSPIMGAGYYTPISQWSKGEYNNSTQKQDDLATITDRSAARTALAGFWRTNGDFYQGSYCDANGGKPEVGDKFYMPNSDNLCTGSGEALDPVWIISDRANYMKDDAGNDQAHAKALSNANGSFKTAGLISQTNDVDAFKVSTDGGTVKATVEVADIAANLNAKLVLKDASGKTIAENAGSPKVENRLQASGLGATVSADNLPKGDYYLYVDGAGFGTPNTAEQNDSHGFTQYGSLGNYTLSGTAAPMTVEIVPVDITAPTDGSTVAGNSDITVSGTATPGAEVTLTVDGKVVGTANADASGKWSTKVNVGFGDTTITASQTVNGEKQEKTDSVTVKAPVTAPSITAPANGSTTEDTTPGISGTGIAGATLTVTITDSKGNETVREVKVSPEGTWSVNVELELGKYTVVAKQAIDGLTSANSAAVAFTIVAADDEDPKDDDPKDDPKDDNPRDDDDDLATTGSNFDAGIFALLGGAVIAIGGGTLLFARRRANQES